MTVLNFRQLGEGDRVQHELLVLDRSEKKLPSGDSFVVLTLGNSTGQLSTAPIWPDKLHLAEGAERGRVVQAIGQVSTYQRKRQLTLTSPLRVMPVGHARLEDFLPRIAMEVQPLWDYVDRTRAEIESPRLRAAIDLFFGDDEFRVRFERTPGSVAGHHARIGGLLLHVVEVTRIAKAAAKTMRVNADLVVAGALLHDVGKVEAYAVDATGFTHTTCGSLLGHVVLGCLMLERRMAALVAPICSPGQLLDLQHMILSHHGLLEFGSPVQPMTAEAELVHWADEASAKGNDMMEAIDDPEAFASGGEISDRKSWRVNRRVWKRPHSWD